jgi:hypothetical protein
VKNRTPICRHTGRNRRDRLGVRPAVRAGFWLTFDPDAYSSAWDAQLTTQFCVGQLQGWAPAVFRWMGNERRLKVRPWSTAKRVAALRDVIPSLP